MAQNYPQPATLVEIAGESGRMNFSQGKITGTRVGEVAYAELYDAVKYILGAIVIGTGGAEIIYPGHQWPGIPNLIASGVTVELRGQTANSDDWDTIIPHTRARITAEYSTPNWNQSTGGNTSGPENEPYLIENVDYSCEVLSIPVKVTDGSNTKEVKRHFRIPTIAYTVEIPKLLRPNWALIQDLSGKINTTTVFGGAAGTVLFDGPKFNREVMPTSDYSWKATYKFIYNRFGWNNQLHPDTLEWVPATAIDGANLPYETANLKQLWENIRL